jgi:hypothetical protein
MSNTISWPASLAQSPTSGGSSIHLPVPRVSVAQPLDYNGTPVNPNGVDYSFALDGTKISFRKMPVVSTVDLPAMLLNPSFDTRLELIEYKRELGRSATSGFRHPTHFISDAGSASPTGGSPVAPVLPKSRFTGSVRPQGNNITEWSITQRRDILIDSLGNQIGFRNISYRNTDGSTNVMGVYTQSNAGANGSNSMSSKGHVHSSKYRGFYVQFRYSIKDPNGIRQDRLYGPLSQVLYVAPATDLMIVDTAKSNDNGFVCGYLNPQFDSRIWTCNFSKHRTTRA